MSTSSKLLRISDDLADVRNLTHCVFMACDSLQNPERNAMACTVGMLLDKVEAIKGELDKLRDRRRRAEDDQPTGGAA